MGKPDMSVFVLTLILVMLGILMVYSSSTTAGRYYYDDTEAFLFKQLSAALIGLGLLFALIFIPYESIRDKTPMIVFLMVIFLLAVFMPFLGHSANHARRWIGLGPIRLQPSEFAKIGMVIYLAMIMTKKRAEGMLGALRGFLPPLLVMGLVSFLIYLEPDLSTAVFILALGLTLFLMGGVPAGHVIGMVLATIPFGLALIFSHEYMKNRLFAHLDPLSDAANQGYQILQSLLSFQNGGVFGKGVGHGVQKMGALPEAHTDFILAAQTEEIGALGITVLLVLILALVWRIFRVAFRAQDGFARLFCFGMGMLIGWQALINAAMVTGLMPTTGLPFPFFSYGGSSLIALCFGLGIVLNISRKRES